MENYKIRVNNEAESKEAQELFFELGYEWHAHGKKVSYLDVIATGDFGYLVAWKTGCFSEHIIQMGCGREDAKEITLAELRDVVVLKRNDVKDATHTCENGFKYIFINYRWYLMTTDGWFQVSVNPKALKPILTVQAVLNDLDGLREEYKDYQKDQALISGADALRALADGKEVEFKHDTQGWVTCLGLNIERVLGGWHQMRLKPQAVKLELELPKPFEPEEDCHVYILDDGKTDGYRCYFYEVHGDKGNEFIGIWKTEDEIKQVVEQLRKIKGAV